jgi:hypothetical protein
VKIDAEGAEVEILEGMGETMERYGPILIVEVFQRNIEKNLCLSNPCGKSIVETQIYTRYKKMNSIKGANLKVSFKYFLFLNIDNPEKNNSIQNVSGNDCIKSSEKMLSLLRKSDIE